MTNVKTESLDIRNRRGVTAVDKSRPIIVLETNAYDARNVLKTNPVVLTKSNPFERRSATRHNDGGKIRTPSFRWFLYTHGARTP